MTLSSATSRVSYTGNGAVDTYAYTFKVFDQDDLLVTVKNTSNVETTLTITTDYTVSGVGDTGGGSIALVNSSQAWLDVDGDLLTGYILVIRRVRSIVQETDIRNQGTFYPETHEDEFDKLTMVDQQQQDELDRSMKLPETLSSLDFDPTLPTDINTADVLLKVNSAGTAFENGPTATDIADAEANAIAAAASAVAAAASEVAAAASAASVASGAFTVPLTVAEVSTPSTPSSGNAKLYPKSDNLFYQLNDGGIERRFANDLFSGGIHNIGASAAVAANALTVTVTTAGGATPTATNRGSVLFRSSTLTSGALSLVDLTATLALTISSGSTLNQLAGIESIQYWYFINSAGTIKLGVCRMPLDESLLHTSVAEGGAGAADSSSVLYSDAVYSSCAIRLFLKVTNTQATPGTWITAPSNVAIFPFEIPSVSCLMFKTSSQNPGTNALTKTTWESVSSAEGGFDPFGMCDLANDRLVCRKSGRHSVTLSLSLANFEVSTSLQVFLRKNGSSFIRYDVATLGAGTTRTFYATMPMELVVDDYLEIATQSGADSSYDVIGVSGLGDSTSYFGMSLIK